jgi:DNA polymerase III epsilon subunit-like protein
MPKPKGEIFISIDVETAGPNPGNYAMLAIGACLVFEPQKHFYVEIQPQSTAITKQALQVSQLDIANLKRNGEKPQDAMRRFANWVEKVTPPDHNPIFVAFNAAFDWMFVNDYFHRYLGYNPFGHKALDIKSFYMGLFGVPFGETGMKDILLKYPDLEVLSHHALQDAQDQAKIFRKLLQKVKERIMPGKPD